MNSKKRGHSAKRLLRLAQKHNIVRLVVMECFMARVKLAGVRCVLKGGLAIQIRTNRPRATKDVDIIVTGNPEDFLEVLRAVATTQHADPFEFEVKPDPKLSEMATPGIEYGGRRFIVVAHDGSDKSRVTFKIEAVFNALPDSETIVSRALERFGYPPVEIQAVPVLHQIGDKVWLCCEAARNPRDNAYKDRYRDLADVYLLSTLLDAVQANEVHTTVAAQFERRATTTLADMPAAFPDPPLRWMTDSDIANTLLAFTGLDSVDEVLIAVREFINPVLDGSVRGKCWDATERDWRDGEAHHHKP